MNSRVSWECASVLGFNRWRAIAKILCVSALLFLLQFSLLEVSPGRSQSALAAKLGRSEAKAAKTASRITETAPPSAIEQLRQDLEDYQPQVSILSPKPNEVLSEDTVAVKLQVKDLPIFKDKLLGLGPHLHVLLDNSQYQAVYNTDQPLMLEKLPPGTHTIRAFASRPWHESFKNDGAYAQVTFHVFAKTQENSPDPKLPLLTYSRPQASYGAEPIMLDFYLTNAPLHLVAQENDKDDIADWRIRATVNGESFVVDRWQPIYLKGFKPGKNWVQLEFLDEKGQIVQNTFNNTARLITYDPNGKDTLSKLVRGELTAQQARGIVDPTYVPEPVPAPVPKPTPTSAPSPKPSPTASPVPAKPTPSASPVPTIAPTLKPTLKPIDPIPSPTPSPVVKVPAAKPQRSRQVEPTPAPTPTSAPMPSPTPLDSPSSIVTPKVPKVVPKEVVPKVNRSPIELEPAIAPIETPQNPPVSPSIPTPQPEKPGLFERLRRQFGVGQEEDKPAIASPQATSQPIPPAADAKAALEKPREPRSAIPPTQPTPVAPDSIPQFSTIPKQLEAPKPPEPVPAAEETRTNASREGLP